jgi:hypothetical protein
MSEEWRPVPGFPGYEASSIGRVRSLRNTVGRPRAEPVILKLRPHSGGYLNVGMGNRTFYVHRVVLMAFTGACPAGLDACHWNGDRKDNRVTNLRWATRRENLADKDRHGTTLRGSTHPVAKLTEDKLSKAKELLVTGMSQSKVATLLGVSQSVISRSTRGITWRHAQ